MRGVSVEKDQDARSRLGTGVPVSRLAARCSVELLVLAAACGVLYAATRLSAEVFVSVAVAVVAGAASFRLARVTLGAILKRPDPATRGQAGNRPGSAPASAPSPALRCGERNGSRVRPTRARVGQWSAGTAGSDRRPREIRELHGLSGLLLGAVFWTMLAPVSVLIARVIEGGFLASVSQGMAQGMAQGSSHEHATLGLAAAPAVTVLLWAGHFVAHMMTAVAPVGPTKLTSGADKSEGVRIR